MLHARRSTTAASASSGVEGRVGPAREPAGRIGVRLRCDDGGPPHRPAEKLGAVTGERDGVLLAVEEPERDLGVVLADRRTAAFGARRVRDREAGEVELVRAVLRGRGPLRDGQTSLGQRHAGERAERCRRVRRTSTTARAPTRS